MSESETEEPRHDSSLLGRVLPFAPEPEEAPAADNPADPFAGVEAEESTDNGLPMAKEEPAALARSGPLDELVQTGDEPDRPYDLTWTPPVAARVQQVLAPSADPVLRYAVEAPPTIVERVATAISGERPVDVISDQWDPWDGSIAKGLLVPGGILFVGVLFTFYATGQYSPNFHGLSHAVRYTIVNVVVRVAAMWLAVWGIANSSDVNLGRVQVAGLKLAAIAVAPGIVIGIVLVLAGMAGIQPDNGFSDYMNGNLTGAVASGFLSLVTLFCLFYYLFDLEMDSETWRFVLILWIILFFVAGLVVHLILDPPPYTLPYVPDKNPLRWRMGN